MLGNSPASARAIWGADRVDVYPVLERAVSLAGAVSRLVVSAHSWSLTLNPGQFSGCAHLLGNYLTALILVSLPLTRF